MRRSTVILLIIFLLLGGLVWMTQQPGNPIKNALATSTPTSFLSTDVLINPDKSRINSISIQDVTGKSITIKKTGDQWVVNNGIDQPADQSQAESEAGQALNLKIIKKFDTAPDPAGTGLDNPTFIISIILADSSIFNIKIGKATVTGSGYYAMNTDGRIYILSKSEVDQLTLYLSKPPLLQTATPPAPETQTQLPGATSGDIEGTATSLP